MSAGAYGLRIEGLGSPPALCLTGIEAWPAIEVGREVAAGTPPERGLITEQSAVIINPAGILLADRAASKLTVSSAVPVPDADLVHPGLWPAAAVFARWRGAETLHAGAFVAPGERSAWGVMADSGGGKSSFLAALVMAGCQVLVDDLLVLEAGECCAGPRSIDLRPDTVVRLGLEPGRTSPVRSTSRARMALAPCAGRWPIAGFVELAWGSAVSAQWLAPSGALAALARHRRVVGLGAELDQLLEHAGRPLLRLTRPPSWEATRPAIEALMDAVATAGP